MAYGAMSSDLKMTSLLHCFAGIWFQKISVTGRTKFIFRALPLPALGVGSQTIATRDSGNASSWLQLGVQYRVALFQGHPTRYGVSTWLTKFNFGLITCRGEDLSSLNDPHYNARKVNFRQQAGA